MADKPIFDKAALLAKLSEATAPPAAESVDIVAGSTAALAPSSSTALKLDDWSLRRGRELLAESTRLQKLKLTTAGDPAADRAALEAQEHAVADFHAAAFDMDPTLTDGCVEPRRHQFCDQLFQTPEYHALHASTVLDVTASEIATAAFAEQYAKLVEKDIEKKKKEEEAAKKAGKGKPGPGKAGGGKKPSAADEAGDEIACMSAVAKAVSDATEKVEDLREAQAACGMGPGSAGAADASRVAALYAKIRSSPMLRRVFDAAGRFRRFSQSRQRSKTIHGYDDMVGVKLDGDPGRLLPHELVQLATPPFQGDAMRRLVERQSFCREYQAKEKIGKGPVIITCDESGSMQGRPNEMSKAIALTMAWIARSQKRWCGLIAFSGDSGHRMLTLPPGGWDEMAVVEWVEGFLSHGSNMDVPVREMPEFYAAMKAPAGKTDLIWITDAICHVPKTDAERFLAWKKSVQARLVTLVINSEPGDLAVLSDEVYQVPTLDIGVEGVDRVLSL